MGWSLAGILGVTAAVTIAVKDPLPGLPRGADTLVAILAGWIMILAFAPWRSTAALGRDRRVILDLARELQRTLTERGAERRTLTERGGRRLRDIVLERDDELGALSRVIHRALAEAEADRRASRLLKRTMDEKVRRETNRATRQLKREATTDPLTGLSNRRAMQKRLDELFASDRRRRGDCVVAMVIDVDLFKTVNDTLGHEVGDQCLAFLGHLLSSTLRGEDVAIRLGGDEFTVLMPNLSMEEARAVAHRLSALFAQMPWPYRRVAKPTLSVGLALGWCGDPSGPTQLMRRADAALYQAKAAGRNTVCAYEDRTRAA